MLKIIAGWRILGSTYFCIAFIVSGCGKSEEIDLKKFTPKQSYKYYSKARRTKGNTHALRQIMYFPSSMNESEIEEKIKKTLASSSEKMYNPLATHKVVYEKIISEDTSQIGIVIKPSMPGLPHIPFNEAILKKENGVWKFFIYKTALVHNATEKQLLADIKNNPSDASLYYYLGTKYRAKGRYVKLKEYFKKYYNPFFPLSATKM